MILYGLRLLVALLTFAVGIAAAWLLDFKSAPVSSEREVKTISVLVSDETTPPPRHACSLESRRVVAGGTLQGKAISKPQPVYPPDAKAARVSGTVVVQIEVGEAGSVVKAEAVSGPEMLREAAEDAALAARFSPTLLSGQPVRVSGVITYNFVLN
ncbi:MAG TPA: TonB family protein [Pyrinomonadaceae bacterium]|jgi:protein TonB